VPQGPQAFSLVISGPAVALSQQACGAVPAPSGVDPAPDPALETASTLRSQVSMYRITTFGASSVAGALLVANVVVLIYLRRTRRSNPATGATAETPLIPYAPPLYSSARSEPGKAELVSLVT
jgi:hypothetical protein